MTGKELVAGREVLDGEPVAEYQGRFTGAFDIDYADGTGITQDDTVSFIVTARVDSFASKKTKAGDRKRINVLKVVDSHMIDKHEARYILDEMDVQVPGINMDGAENVAETRIDNMLEALAESDDDDKPFDFTKELVSSNGFHS